MQRDKVELYANYLKENGIINDYFYSEDYINSIFEKYEGTNRESFFRKPKLKERIIAKKNHERIKSQYDGLIYSAGPMVAIECCKTKWLLYVTQDVKLPSDDKWIELAISYMNDHNDVLFANPLWNNDLNTAEAEKISEDGDFWLSHGFSDQCFLTNVSTIRSKINIYSEKNNITEYKYPFYGGNLFERRISAYLRNHDLKRITYKHSSYIHKDITNDEIAKYQNRVI